jgi:hypothetical protein
MDFQTWSKTNPEVVKVLKPGIGSLSWDHLTVADKNNIWQYLYRAYFFDKTPRFPDYAPASGHLEREYVFGGNDYEVEVKRYRIGWSVFELNHRYKRRSYGKHSLEETSWFNGCQDFHSIFMTEQGHVVLELLSIYCEGILGLKRPDDYAHSGETDQAFKKRIQKMRHQEFDGFAEDLNEVFSQFELDVYLTRQGFMPVQEKKIIETVYQPVLSAFTDPKWKSVNDLIALSFKEFEKKTPEGYSICITTTVSAVQAFLQLLVHGKTGKGEISKLIPVAQTMKKIPSDPFSSNVFNNIESILARERQEKSVAHPPKSVADEKNALLLMNLAMVFFQHCLPLTP